MMGSMNVKMQMLLLERLDVTGRPGLLLLDKEGGVYGDNEWTEQKLKKRDWQQHRGMTESDGCRSHQGTGPLQLIKERHKQAILWTLPRAWMSAGVKAHKLLLAQVAPKEPAK